MMGTTACMWKLDMTPGSWNELSLGNETKTFLASDSRTVHIVCSSQENRTVKFYFTCLHTYTVFYSSSCCTEIDNNYINMYTKR